MKTLKYILTLLLPFWLLLAISLYWFAGLITADVELLLSGATPELAAATHSHITMGLGLIIVLISICFVVTMLTHWRASVKLIELKTLFRAAPCGILTIDSKGRVRKANNQAMQLFGIARGQTKQLHIDQLLPLELQFAQTKISQSLVDEVGVADLNNMSSQFFARKLNGDEFPINLSVSNALARGEKNSIMIIKDVSFENKLINEAQTDGLTKVNNRKASEDFLATGVNRANRYNVNLSAILLDIDHFSKINTRIGREHADQLLIDIAQIINKNMRDTDFLSRWGGEEFKGIIIVRLLVMVLILMLFQCINT